MVNRRDEPSGDERETVSYSIPRRLARAVALHAIEADLKSKSHAAEDLIERGLRTIQSAPVPERQPEAVAS